MKYKKQLLKICYIFIAIASLSFLRVIYFYAQPIWLNRIASYDDIKKALLVPDAVRHIDDYDEEGLTGLMLAATFNFDRQAQLLLENGASVNLQARSFDNADPKAPLGPTLDTALHLAVKQRNLNIIQLLLKFGANVNAINNLGDAPLFDAIDIEGKELRDAVMALLLNAGAALNRQNNIKMSILHKAVEKADPELVQTLIRDHLNSLDFQLRNAIGQTPAEEARSLYHLDIAGYLEDGYARQVASLKFPVTADTQQGFASLMGAIKRDDLKQVVYLIERKVDVNGHDVKDHNNTPLHIACFFSHPKIVLYLLEHGAIATAVNDNGDTPILALVNFQDMNELTKVLNNLIAQGGNLNAQNKQGNTLVHRAVEKNNRDLVRFLISEFAFELNLKLKNRDGMTPLELAKHNKLPEIVAILEKA